MQEVDLAAETMLDIVAVELEREANSRRSQLHFRGTLPKDPYLQRYIRGAGIIKHLQVEHEYLSSHEEDELRVLRTRNRSYRQEAVLSGADYKERTVAGFVDHIDECLKTSDRALSIEQRRRLAEYTGEILTNVEEHSDNNEWTIVGYLDTSHPGHLCEIAIINLGRSIADTFRILSPDSQAFKVVEPYIDAHEAKNLFGLGWREENLLTLIALQGHVSSKADLSADRGQGTVDLIEFFQEMHRESQDDDMSNYRMAIMSGRTHIMFDGRYQMSEDQHGRKVIAFNADNDLRNKPDKKYVTSLRTGFPGTIISIRFPTQ